MNYNCFTEKGENKLPDSKFIEQCFEQGIEPVIYLDSCVCLHIIKVVDYGKAAKDVDFSRIINLKQYLEKHPTISISPFFALLELCSQKGTFDKQKLQDFKTRIEFFEQISLKDFRTFKYDFHRDFFVFKNIAATIKDPLMTINPIIKNSYCSLLKIRSIALKGLTKDKAENNLNELIKWMIDDLGIVRGAEYKLAMNIFGGNTEFRKMVGLDCKQAVVKRKLLGTTWDMFHSKFTANSFRISEVLQRLIYPFFLTSDANLFRIFQHFGLEVIKDGGENFVSSFIMTSDFSYPHFDQSFIDRHNEKMLEVFLDRRNHEYDFDELKVSTLISALEFENGLA